MVKVNRGERIIDCASHDGGGDGTVPTRSGAHPRVVGGACIQEQLGIDDIEHEGAYKGSWHASAHDDEMKLNALKDLTITSTAGRVVIAAKDDIWLGAGGSYIKIVPEGVEIGTAGDVVCKCDRLDKLKPATDTTVATTFPPIAPTDRLRLTAAASPASLHAVPVGMPYQLLANGVMIQEGVTAGDGRFHVERHVTTDYYQLKLANGVVHSIPLSIANEEEEEASRANSGYQAHKVADSRESACGDPHETRYADLLHPETGTDA